MKTTGLINKNIRGQEAAPTPIRNGEDAKKLLDAISSIIANEYIEIAKKNPEVFGGGK